MKSRNPIAYLASSASDCDSLLAGCGGGAAPADTVTCRRRTRRGHRVQRRGGGHVGRIVGPDPHRCPADAA
ncbi:MAG: hypothetical protein R2856_22995 [Caldilineaceae bacterium]